MSRVKLLMNSLITRDELDKILGYTGGMTISNLWDCNAREHPDRAAIEDPRASLTWAEAKQWVDRVALGLLDLGIERDEALIVQLPNSIELHLLRVVGEKAGICCLPVTSNMRKTELEHILGQTDAVAAVIPSVYRGFNYADMIDEIRSDLPYLKHIFTVGDKPRTTDLRPWLWGAALTGRSEHSSPRLRTGRSVVRGKVPDGLISLRELVEQPLEEKYPADCFAERRYRGEEVSLICHSSGSTGFPKLVKYSPAACSATGKWFMEHLRLTADDIVAAIAPAARGPNLPVYFAAPWAAAKIVMLPWGEAKEALKAIEERKITVACLVPTQLAMMLEQAQAGHYDLSSVRVWISAGATFPPPLMAEVEKKLGGTVLNYYGSMELGAVTSSGLDDPYDVRMTTAGKPTFGAEVKIVDGDGKEAKKGAEGEIVAKGLCSSSGFYKDEKATEEVWNEEGWAVTGDMGMIDEHGNLIIVGRKKDMIIRGGQNIYPAEIESLLIDHPKVQDVAVVAMPDPVMGEKVCAYVVPMIGETFTFDEMVSFLKQKKIAAFKLPEGLELVDRFPTVADGYKVDKKVLRHDIAQKLGKPRTTDLRPRH